MKSMRRLVVIQFFFSAVILTVFAAVLGLGFPVEQAAAFAAAFAVATAFVAVVAAVVHVAVVDVATAFVAATAFAAAAAFATAFVAVVATATIIIVVVGAVAVTAAAIAQTKEVSWWVFFLLFIQEFALIYWGLHWIIAVMAG